ncbi:PEP/pyruvate-binding domain-containing protein [Clostridium sp. A1-XYC3]|uniref:PEP/pyruvate-binding domain-containing protein n=1 Tax=Clostridium tanneri TaxID=3037988 RepID=A0ABU4JPZ5_9CLOT|nr:PEP/pyruvate-binding domain-containing protein [Clostridium sp. A1-XYC3]MDW8800224.1 PEP/pyruvate-binding domain-containing protein [Clostridium sp. A1-XYC3]
MPNMVKSFKDLTPELQAFAGGKGGSLARMYQDGYPVPDGFVVLPSAFQEQKLNDEAWNEIRVYLNTIRKNHEGALFAVRSSALSEDSAQASFAGEFETVLNVKTDKEIWEAIYTVFRSRESERVKAYSTIQGMEQSHQIAVVIMLMVQSEISGVLFTADPITGSHTSMAGNFVYGLGEQLVSGEANAYPFKLMRPKGKYEGPNDFMKYASELYKHAAKLVKELGCQQDIEWAVARGKVYILQARPITTLNTGNLDTYELNDTLDGDFLWTNTNVGEAMADVFTPLSWSVIRALDEEQMVVPGYYLFSGNICGRMYSNVNLALSIYPAFGKDYKSVLKKMNDIFGQMPEGMNIPIYPYSGLGLIKAMIPGIMNTLKKSKEVAKAMPNYLKDTPNWCRTIKERIERIETSKELLSLWKEELWPYNCKALWVGRFAPRKKLMGLFKLNEELPKLLGKEDANTLLSNLRGSSELESLGPVVGISKIIKGELSREEYLMKYGHRGPHEFEISIPDPSEDKAWLEKQIEEFKKSNVDAEGLLKKQHTQYEKTLKKLEEYFPGKAKKISKQIADASEGSYLREAARSEWTRVFRVNRAFALKAGNLTGIGEDVFFLYLDEVLNLLSGDKSALKHIPARRKTYEKYKALPPLPSIIRGRFDPFKWSEDPKRRVDYYDPDLKIVNVPDSETLKGFAGAAGRVEGVVRVLTNPEEGENLKSGEILVASTTNVGWTPLFPKAAAIITDIGAPLSHAAIVARELGIPAVVGCGNATTRLKTGDRVLVKGGQGVVHILV